MKRYRKGADKERRLKKKLEKEGYWVVRAAGSKGVADLVAIKDGRPYLIQVKHERIARKEAQQLKAIADACGAVPVLALWKRKLRRFLLLDLREGESHDETGTTTQPAVDATPDPDAQPPDHPCGTEGLGVSD
jgi:Holliday junction resolvase